MHRDRLIWLVSLALALVLSQAALAAKWAVNVDESKVPRYTLPDPLVMSSGQRVADAAAWRTNRRPEILKLFETYVYGKAPGRSPVMIFDVRESSAAALGNKATRKQVCIRFSRDPQGPKMNLLIYLPNAAKKPVPVFLGLNFRGNQSVHSDPAILDSDTWLRNDPRFGIADHRGGERMRGADSSRWQVEMVLARGYGLATACYNDIERDAEDGLAGGVRPLFFKPGQTRPAPDEWGAIGAWAWGLSRALDYLETDRDVDAKRVIVLGHSRLGKTALWAGARDERFAAVISNESGRGGAALTRRQFGETSTIINTAFPHWFCGNFKHFNDRVEQLPVDQHMLLALVAPRPVYVASAEEDTWADPRGSFLAALAADPVYRLLGTDGLAVREMPPVEKPVTTSTIGYHLRHGKHDVTEFDWKCFLDFADRHVRK